LRGYVQQTAASTQASIDVGFLVGRGADEGSESGDSETGPARRTASGATAAAAESAPMAAHGRHTPIIEWREFARPTAALARRAVHLPGGLD
jgi:hypothetical protein